MTSWCTLNHRLRMLMATTTPGKGQDKGTCRFSGKGTHQTNIPFCTKSNVAHLRAGSTRWHTCAPNSPLSPSIEHNWDGKVPRALEEHSQDEVSSLSNTGFWKFLATNTVPAQAVGLLGVRGGARASASSDEEQEQEKVASWRESSAHEDN